MVEMFTLNFFSCARLAALKTFKKVFYMVTCPQLKKTFSFKIKISAVLATYFTVYDSVRQKSKLFLPQTFQRKRLQLSLENTSIEPLNFIK